ncbi:hypothetical protein PS1M3_28320 [Pseudoalteromonas sp. PS1M3]|nr:hypothetical protein PS1M3_28320 [Pseudoalteromonas sp. PS1M3]
MLDAVAKSVLMVSAIAHLLNVLLVVIIFPRFFISYIVMDCHNAGTKVNYVLINLKY